MKYVEIYKLQNNGDQKVVLKCFLRGENVEFEGEGEQLAKNLITDGIKNYLEESIEALYPKDGLKFLQNMMYNFTSGYLNASDVLEQ